MKTIKLLAVDIDGCITPGEGAAADLDVLKQLCGFNARAESDPLVPAVSLCTGRQQPYVDLLAQLIGARRPSVFENGAGLHVPADYSFHFHPAITADMRRALADFERAVEEKMCARGAAKLQPGKEVSLSVYPGAGYTVQDNAGELEVLLESTGAGLVLDVSINCINVLFAGIDKGSGIKWLADFEGIRAEETGAVGDAPGDLPALAAAGFSACPANAVAQVRAAADYRASGRFGAGVVEIVEEVIRMNSSGG